MRRARVGQHNVDGSGSLLALAVIGAIAGVLGITVPLYLGLVARAGAEGAADASALAAADVAAGISPGIPCRVAAQLARANGAALMACEVDGRVVSVGVETRFLGFTLAASATAGPPGVGTN
jgi:secretion/DNA translocation related TadE-like protein